LFLVKKIPLSKRKCEVARCCDATASSFVATAQVDVFAHFQAVTAVCGIDCLACQEEFFANNPLEQVQGLRLTQHWFEYFI
jgi:hypothetical protein